MNLTADSFKDILDELESRPLPINRFRKHVGDGRSQTFGVVHRRNLHPDYSRLCWLRPKLYKHLLDFADKYVDISYNAITVNQNYKSMPHYDKHNNGNSYLVAFGDFTDGTLKIHESDLSGNHDIKYNPIKADFSKLLHSTNDWSGNRYSLVFYQFDLPNRPVNLPLPSVRLEDDIYKFYRGEEYIDKKVGLPHNLKGRKKSNVKE
tara:strand:+ start:127 stop:744 length:618 start_codon:yes stop_codon:yes gene_type:complete